MKLHVGNLSQRSSVSKASRVDTAFINIPYAPEYEERLLAFVASLALYGLIPTAAMVAGDSPKRLDRIIAALSECTLSIHDLTWMELDGVDAVPRFNMPFELGIAVAVASRLGNTFVVVDTVPHRLDKALSDVRAFDADIIDDTPLSVFRALSNVFHRSDFQPEPRHFALVLEYIRGTAARLRADFGYRTIFEAKPFAEIRRAAAQAVSEIREEATTREPVLNARPLG